MLNFLTALWAAIKSPIGRWVSIVLLGLFLVGFGTQLPVVQDAIVAVKGFKAYFDRRGWESDIKDIQKSLDSTQAVVKGLKQSSDSLEDVISTQNILLRKRGRSIDSINGAIKHLDSLRRTYENKKEIVYEDIKDHNRFVDSLLAYRSSVLAGGSGNR